ncbi:hypothetical protein LGQ02_02115 [Bacillus shivajii]|uniref:hypothetical protein n=1 Tax=Bacillus shivajii TaxID=1983719 RepID=UPI001CFAF208|nr:hypothetical protein [Bacillus shivajii]UCZ53616.1 hypothetical protein LGQ02_02115 [Bacillus shivajii]
MFLITPLFVLSYLSRIPETFLKKIIHTTKWVAYSTFLEHIIHEQKMIQFKYGWNVYWSGLVYFKMYIFSYLYPKRPLLTWLLSICSAIFFIWKFNVPLTKRLLKGPIFIFVPTRYKFLTNYKILFDSFWHSSMTKVKATLMYNLKLAQKRLT